MVYGWLTGIVFLIIICVCVMMAAKILKDKKNKNKKSLIAYFSAAAVSFILLLCIPFSFHQVNTGEVAVVKELGKAKATRSAGTYFDFWMTKNYEYYDTKVQQVTVLAPTYSSDGQTLNVEVVIQYQIQPEHAIEIATIYGDLSVLESRIKAVSIERMKSVLSANTAMGIIETRSQVSQDVTAVISSAISEDYYIDITNVVLTNIDFTREFEKSVEEKVIAQQEAEKAKNEAARRETEAEAAKKVAILAAEAELETAKLQMEAKIVQAQAEAEAEILVAQAAARSIKLKSVEVARAMGFTITEETVTDEEGIENIEYNIDFTGKSAEEIQLITDYLKYIEYLSKWDGVLPSVLTGDSATIMIPVPNNP